LAGTAGDAGGDVQDPVPERVDFTGGQIGVLAEADQFRPRHQICCGQDDFQPSGVRVAAVTGQVTQPGGLGLTDPVLDPGLLAVTQFQSAELARDDTLAAVGDERGAVPVARGRCGRTPMITTANSSSVS
jgi:hypothetical protein